MRATYSDAVYDGPNPDIRGKAGTYVPGHPFSFEGEDDRPDGRFFPAGSEQGYDCFEDEVVVEGKTLSLPHEREPTLDELAEIDAGIDELFDGDDEDVLWGWDRVDDVLDSGGRLG